MAGSKKEIGTGFITEVDRYLFNNGRHYEIFEKMGAHPKKYKGKNGMYFAVWAPHAEQIGVVGDFNSWDPEANAMKPGGFRHLGGICPWHRCRRAIQIRHHNEKRQNLIQGRSLCVQRGIPPRYRFRYHRSLGLPVGRRRLDR